MNELVISSPRGKNGKSRSFRSVLLAWVEADDLWHGGQTQTDNVRPVWAMFAASDQELRTFVANLMQGKKAQLPQDSLYSKRADYIELLKSVPYSRVWQREEEGSLFTAFLPDLFQMDPGMVDTQRASFIALPSKEWLKQQRIEDVPAIVRHAKEMKPKQAEYTDEELADLIPMAFLFCAYLDRRTRGPLLSDGRFYLQFMLACLEHGLASWSKGSRGSYSIPKFGMHPRFEFYEDSTDKVGLAPGIAFDAAHDTLEYVLSEQVTRFFEKVGA